ncbi:hypothetical protein VRU48_07630 [Pedobacter sp. KR3-3]|uniref:Uncharacterized protein n=1 Tax=Pedobacter albus TaxID=3113905 RepID=A0ABU7I675_9SPHI|nr:hypothetical protein [Pedobacter sp. KR3-3]MEE1944971.1 hypothetical protein [Pedobacter sp. KR3-3]
MRFHWSILLAFALFSCPNLAKSQDFSFTFIKKFKDEKEIQAVADSLKTPLLITENKIYAIGGDCITRELGGDATGREEDGDQNNRDKDGNMNNREKGGGVGDRDKKGKASQRGKDGDILGRDKAGSTNQRDQDGQSSIGTRCGVTKNGKLMLYTRESMNAKQTKIYYNGKYYSNKYYKIIQL